VLGVVRDRAGARLEENVGAVPLAITIIPRGGMK
jgi:hypothetical protein